MNARSLLGSPFLAVTLVFTLFSVLLTNAQTDGEPPQSSYRDSLILHFQQEADYVREKLYLHHDRPYYSAGEVIWFKGYLVNAARHTPDALSNYIYVELRDRYDSLYIRRKYMKDSLQGFIGQIELSDKIPAGNYTLRAYTQWMRNSPDAHHYQKSLEIANPLQREITSTVSYQWISPTRRLARIHLQKRTGEPLSGIYLYCQLNASDYEEIAKEKRLKTDNQGNIEYTIDYAQIANKKVKPELQLIVDDPTYKYHQKYPIPTLTNNYHVSFHPEGGTLLSGVAQRVAFKAQHESGFSESIRGILTNQQGDTLAQVETLHDGMGELLIHTTPTDTLTLHCRSNRGEARSFTLPVAQTKGVTLLLQQNKSQIICQAHTPAGQSLPGGLHLVAHTREQLIYTYPLTEKASEVVLPDSLFPAGITQFLLTDNQGRTLSRRLFFQPPNSVDTICITPHKPKCEARQLVTLDIQLPRQGAEATSGNYSLSITDPQQVVTEPYTDNIVSNLLLTSDLSGYIHHPAYYLQSDRKSRYHADLLMLTHGWSRFATDSLLSLTPQSINYPLEMGQYITGQVRNYFGKPLPHATVYALSTRDSIYGLINADEAGRYIIAPLNHRDSTTFLLKATTAKGKEWVELLIDRETYPESRGKNPTPERFSLLPDSYLENSYQQYIAEGGSRTLHLKEVVVYGQAARNSLFFNTVLESNSLTVRSLIGPKTKSLWDAFMRIRGMVINKNPPRPIGWTHGGGDYIAWEARYNNRVTYVLINEIPVSSQLELLQEIDIEDVAAVDILHTEDDMSSNAFKKMIYDDRGRPIYTDEYYIYVTLRHPYNPQLKRRPSYGKLRALGYSLPKEFYHPVYGLPDTPDNDLPDRRATLYWNPALQADSTGCMQVQFYSSDSPGNYQIEIEGVTPAGQLVHHRGAIYKEIK